MNTFAIKQTVSKAKYTYGMPRLTVDCGFNKPKAVEVGFGYDMVGALLLKFLKTRYAELKSVWDNINGMLGYHTVITEARLVGVNVDIATDYKGKIIGFIDNGLE